MRTLRILTTAFALLCLLAVALAAWTRLHADAAVADERAALMQADRDFNGATAERGVEGWVEYFAEDGKMFPAGGEIITGKAAIREAMAPAFAAPNFSLRWEPKGADVSASGDLGYTYGIFVAKGEDPKDEPVTRYGKYVSIWRKQSDGSWKVVLDIGNPRPAPPQP